MIQLEQKVQELLNRANSVDMKFLNIILKNRNANPYIRNGLISQLVPLEITIPSGFFPTFFID